MKTQINLTIQIVGSGGREYALAMACAKSPLVGGYENIHIAPGSDGLRELGCCCYCDIKADDLTGQLNLARHLRSDLTIVGPEGPICKNIEGLFSANDLPIFAPSIQAALYTEASKSSFLELMDKYQIPTGWHKTFISYDCARAFLDRHLEDCEISGQYSHLGECPIVWKCDGLTGGKGVIVCDTYDDSLKALDEMMVKRVYGAAGDKVIAMERLYGTEASFMVIASGEQFVALPDAVDYKPRDDYNRGPNTGGMGSFSPNPRMNPDITERIKSEIVQKTLRALMSEARRYVGVLYFGLMLTKDGPKVLEANCRLGDPETQVVLPRLKTDIVELMLGAINRNLPDEVEFHHNCAVCVVMAAPGYPESPIIGRPIVGLNKPTGLPHTAYVVHAGTKLVDGQWVTNGGRFLNVVNVSSSGNLHEAQVGAHMLLNKIDSPSAFHRHDIGQI